MNTMVAVARYVPVVAALGSLAWIGPTWGAGDPGRGATIFQVCAACHSTTAGEHLTGPSLAKIWQRKAGTVEGFSRYSEAMMHADLVWTEATLDQWLSNPDKLISAEAGPFYADRRRFGGGTATAAICRSLGAHLGSHTALDRQQFSVR